MGIEFLLGPFFFFKTKIVSDIHTSMLYVLSTQIIFAEVFRKLAATQDQSELDPTCPQSVKADPGVLLLEAESSQV